MGLCIGDRKERCLAGSYMKLTELSGVVSKLENLPYLVP